MVGGDDQNDQDDELSEVSEKSGTSGRVGPRRVIQRHPSYVSGPHHPIPHSALTLHAEVEKSMGSQDTAVQARPHVCSASNGCCTFCKRAPASTNNQTSVTF
jgi:hypothetical protein